MKERKHTLSIKVIPWISIISGGSGIIWGYLELTPPEQLINLHLFSYYDWQSSLYLSIFIFTSLIGLTLGILSLKLKLGKIKAILGIIFSSIALIIWLFIWFWITGWSVGA